LRWEGADSGAALFGYFLSLLTKSNSPTGEKLRSGVRRIQHARKRTPRRFRALV